MHGIDVTKYFAREKKHSTAHYQGREELAKKETRKAFSILSIQLFSAVAELQNSMASVWYKHWNWVKIFSTEDPAVCKRWGFISFSISSAAAAILRHQLSAQWAPELPWASFGSPEHPQDVHGSFLADVLNVHTASMGVLMSIRRSHQYKIPLAHS